jgi:hypothetical protein
MCGRGERRTSRRRPPGRRSDGETGHRPPAGGRSRRKYRGLRGYLPLRVRHRAPVARVGGAIPRDWGRSRASTGPVMTASPPGINSTSRVPRLPQGVRNRLRHRAALSRCAPRRCTSRPTALRDKRFGHSHASAGRELWARSRGRRSGLPAARYVIGARLRPIHGDRDSAVERLSAGMKVAEQPGLQRLAAGVNNERIRLGIESAAAVNRLRAERTIPHDDGTARMTSELDEDSGIRLLCGSDSDKDHERARRRARDLLAGTDGERRPFGRPQRATSARRHTHRKLQDAAVVSADAATQCTAVGLSRLPVDAGLR